MSAALRRRVSSLEDQQDRISRELNRLKDQIRQEEEGRFVRVTFSGNSRLYCYEVAAPHVGHVETGDYLTVWSPYTGKDEIVKVQAMGRGDWTGRTKIAHPIHWSADVEIPF